MDGAELHVAAFPDSPLGSFHPGYIDVSSPRDLRRVTTYLRAPSQLTLPVIVIGTLDGTAQTPALAPETLCPVVDPRTAIFWLVNRPVRERLAGMDTEELLHFLIFGEWLALTAADRRDHPLGRYIFGPQFIESVNDRKLGVPLPRIAFACAIVSSGRATGYGGLESHAYRKATGGASPQMIRADGARAMTCALGRSSGAPRLRYWLLPDATIEFATVGKHEDGRRS
jgi:hypothetical protein